MAENQDIIKKSGYTVKKHHKPAFEKISKDKREKILKNAVSEFARNGFEAANINIISQKAGISIGSMYNYFSSKEGVKVDIRDENIGLGHFSYFPSLGPVYQTAEQTMPRTLLDLCVGCISFKIGRAHV